MVRGYSRSATDVCIQKQIRDDLRLLRAPVQVTADDGYQFTAAGRAILIKGVGSHVLLEFIGVKIRALIGQKGQAQLAQHGRVFCFGLLTIDSPNWMV